MNELIKITQAICWVIVGAGIKWIPEVYETVGQVQAQCCLGLLGAMCCFATVLLIILD